MSREYEILHEWDEGDFECRLIKVMGYYVVFTRYAGVTQKDDEHWSMRDVNDELSNQRILDEMAYLASKYRGE